MIQAWNNTSPLLVRNRLNNTVIISSRTTGFNPLTINEKGTLDIRITVTRNTVATRYPEILRNKNNEIRYNKVDTSFTLGSSLCTTLLAG